MQVIDRIQRPLGAGLLLAAALALAACGAAPASDDAALADAQATIAALQAENTRLAEELAQAGGAAAEPAGGETMADLMSDLATGVTPAAPESPLAGAAAAAEPTPAPTSPLPTPSPTPFPTYAPEPMGDEPPEGRFVPTGVFVDAWTNNEEVRQSVGWALEEQPENVQMVYQPFENGVMVWVESTRQIYVFYNDGGWQLFDDTFEEGMMEVDHSLSPPAGRQQPVRGFGKVWREAEGVKDRIGWANDKEYPIDGQVQRFEHGTMVQVGVNRYAAAILPDGSTVWHP